MGWTGQVFSFWSNMFTTVGGQSGQAANVPIDGTPYNVVFPTQYQTACSSVEVTVENAPAGSLLGTPVINNRAKNGFTVAIPGGAPGTIASITWTAQGN